MRRNTFTRMLATMAVVGGAVVFGGCGPQSASADQDAGTHAMGEAVSAAVAATPTIKVYKSPTCGCCALWVDHMRAAGFELDVEDTNDMIAVKREAGLPPQLQSCHTALVNGYVFEGHIPAEVIARFLAEAPPASGLAVPGMPVGSPGMEFGDRVDPYDVIQFDADGGTSVYESR